MEDVSVVIPTLNAARTLHDCLESIAIQSVPKCEVIVVDSYSSDDTPRIAERYGRVIQADSGMTEARYIGAKAAHSRYVLNLDSDQHLLPHAIVRALEESKAMVVLGEQGVGEGLVAWVNQREKERSQKDWSVNVDPASGALRPRFYERELLIESLESIPRRIRLIRPCPYAEDSLIFTEARKRSSSVGFVPNAILHHEETSVGVYWKKWIRYGRAAKFYRGTPYEYLVRQRSIGRLARPAGVIGLTAAALRGLPFLLGYYS